MPVFGCLTLTKNTVSLSLCTRHEHQAGEEGRLEHHGGGAGGPTVGSAAELRLDEVAGR